MESGLTTIAVAGAGHCGPHLSRLAHQVGSELARRGAVLLTGGRGGVMAAACAGAREAGGLTVGILPGDGPETSPPNADVTLPLYTGLGQGRNLVLVLSAQAVIAIGGSWGTLSEIALARKHGTPVVLLESWGLAPPDGARDHGLLTASTAEEAVRLALARTSRAPTPPATSVDTASP